MKTFYLAFGVAVLGLYGLGGLFGWEIGGAERAQIPAEVRHSPAGYRSFYFWHTGFRWGK